MGLALVHFQKYWLLRVIFDQWPKLHLGLDVRPEIPILKGLYCMYVLTNVGTLPLTSSLIRQKLHWLIIRSIFKLQVGYSNESTTFTTAQLNVINLFFSYLTKLMKRTDKNWVFNF